MAKVEAAGIPSVGWIMDLNPREGEPGGSGGIPRGWERPQLMSGSDHRGPPVAVEIRPSEPGEPHGEASVVDLRPGRAPETLPRLASEGLAPFDLVFIDATR
jgi:hypothetical protein